MEEIQTLSSCKSNKYQSLSSFQVFLLTCKESLSSHVWLKLITEIKVNREDTKQENDYEQCVHELFHLDCYLWWAYAELLSSQDSYVCSRVFNHHCHVHDVITCQVCLVLIVRDGVGKPQNCRERGGCKSIRVWKCKQRPEDCLRFVLSFKVCDSSPSPALMCTFLRLFQKLFCGPLSNSLNWALRYSTRTLGLFVRFLTLTHRMMLSPTAGTPSTSRDTSKLCDRSFREEGERCVGRLQWWNWISFTEHPNS